MRIWKLALWALLFPLGAAAQVDVNASEVSTTRILFVLDASNSMYGRWEGGTKMEVAQRLMGSMLDSLAQVPNPNSNWPFASTATKSPSPRKTATTPNWRLALPTTTWAA